MAAETDQNPQRPGNGNAFGLPTRTITITGEHSARLVACTLRASRIERTATNAYMGRPSVRDTARRAMERLNHAFNTFEAELQQVEKELENSGRTAQGPKGQNQADQRQNARANGQQRRGQADRKRDTNQGRPDGDSITASSAAKAQTADKPAAAPKPAQGAKATITQQEARPAEKAAQQSAQAVSAVVEATSPAIAPDPTPQATSVVPEALHSL